MSIFDALLNFVSCCILSNTADVQPESLDSKRAFTSMFETGNPNLILVPRGM